MNESSKKVSVQDLVEAIQLGSFRGKGANPKREKNLKVTEQAITDNKHMKRFRESFKRQHGIDFLDNKAFPVADARWDWDKLKEQLAMREADSESTFVQFLRAAINNITVGSYKSVDTTYEDWVTVTNSNRREELYAPNHGVAFPEEVPLNGTYAEVGAAALDIKLQNKKYGSIYAVEWELLEDDQTGTFSQQAALLGEYLRLVSEVLAYAKLASVSGMKYLNLKVPTSETKPSDESSYPWSTSLQGGGANKPSSFGVLNQTNLQAGIIGLMNQVNLQGVKMMVNPKRLLIGPQEIFDAAILLHSSYYPSGTNAAGVVGGPFSINPLGPDAPFKTVTQITATRFMFKNDGTVDGTSKAWYLVDDSKPWFVVQMREPVTIIQENPQSGQSFEKDIIRWKGRTRQNADHIDPRFAWQGNDGSAS